MQEDKTKTFSLENIELRRRRRGGGGNIPYAGDLYTNYQPVLLSIANLLVSPNLKYPLVPEIAEEFKSNYESFSQTTKEWTSLCASS